MTLLQKSQSALVWKCTDLGAGYKPVEKTVEALNFEVRAGERVALVSDNPQTRALLFRVLAGLKPRRQGQLEILGETVPSLEHFQDWDRALSQSVRRRMGVCLETEGLLSNVSIREGMEMLFRFKYGDHSVKLIDGAAKVVQASCERFGLSGVLDRRPNQVSREERRLAALARAFLSKPYVVVLENPTAGVGETRYERVLDSIHYILEQEERTLLLASDDWLLIRETCNRLLVLEEGRLVFDGSPSEYWTQAADLRQELQQLYERRSRARWEDVA